ARRRQADPDRERPSRSARERRHRYLHRQRLGRAGHDADAFGQDDRALRQGKRLGRHRLGQYRAADRREQGLCEVRGAGGDRRPGQLRHEDRGAGAVRQGSRAFGGRQRHRRLQADGADGHGAGQSRRLRRRRVRRRPGQDAAQARLAGAPVKLSALLPRNKAKPAVAERPDRERFRGTMIARGLTKSYKGRQVVNGVSFGVRAGEAVGLLGPNGAGKTTCFYMVTGLVPVDQGTIEIDGYDVTALPMYRRARLGIGYLPQEASIFRGLSVENNIRAILEMTEKGRKARERRLDELLEEFHIAHLRKAPSISLSGGERRRLEIARALASNPNFMLLDEPFAGVDPIAVSDIQQLVRHLTSRGIGVLITDHNVRETLGLVERAYIIHAGQVLTHGVPAEVVENPDVRRLYLGESFSL